MIKYCAKRTRFRIGLTVCVSKPTRAPTYIKCEYNIIGLYSPGGGLWKYDCTVLRIGSLSHPGKLSTKRCVLSLTKHSEICETRNTRQAEARTTIARWINWSANSSNVPPTHCCCSGIAMIHVTLLLQVPSPDPQNLTRYFGSKIPLQYYLRLEKRKNS